MKHFLFFVYLLLGFVIWLFIGAQMLLPIIYGLPRSIYHFFKHEVTFMAIISNLATPVIWCLILIVLGFVFELVLPSLNEFLINNPAFGLGQILATIMLLSSLLTKKGRADLNADYESSTLRRFRKIQYGYDWTDINSIVPDLDQRLERIKRKEQSKPPGASEA
jgi:hypothetical protein